MHSLNSSKILLSMLIAACRVQQPDPCASLTNADIEFVPGTLTVWVRPVPGSFADQMASWPVLPCCVLGALRDPGRYDVVDHVLYLHEPAAQIGHDRLWTFQELPDGRVVGGYRRLRDRRPSDRITEDDGYQHKLVAFWTDWFQHHPDGLERPPGACER